MLRLASGLAREGSRVVVRSVSAVLAVIGFILSPLSWWNDAVVNIPISLALASLLNALTGLDLKIGFTIAYWLTNVGGLILMLVGGDSAYKGRVTKRSIIASLVAGTIYTLVVVGVLDLLV